MDVAARNVRLQLSGGAQPALAPSLVPVHTWGHPQTWERGRPARTVSPRARCPGDIIGYLFTPGVIHKPGSAGVPPAPRLRGQDAQETSSGTCSHLGSSTNLGARASRPHRVSKSKMPSLQETSSLRGQDALAPGDIISPRARCPRSTRHANTYPRCCVSTWQYAIMRRLNECEARHRNGI
jgi:hypothetical protein